MQDQGMKQKVLQEIMDMMDEKDGEQLKAHPKFMAAKIEVAKPKVLAVGDESTEEEGPGEEVEMTEKPESEEEISPEMIEKLIEMMNGK